MSQQVQDYISMSRRKFRRAYDDSEQFIDNVSNLKFNVSHVSEEVKNDKDNREYKVILNEKGFSTRYTNEFMKFITDVEQEGSEAALSGLIPYFKYNGKELTVDDIKGNIALSRLTRVKGYSDREVLSVINTVERLNPNVTSLSVFTDKVNSSVKDGQRMTISVEDMLGDIDPKLTASRKKIYGYYEEKHKLFDEIKKTMKEVLLKWDRVEEELDEEDNPTGKLILGDGVLNDLNDDLEEIKKLYDMMDSNLNYIIKLKPVAIPMYPDSDEGSSLIASNIIYTYIKKIMSDKAETSASSVSNLNEDEAERDAADMSEEEKEVRVFNQYGEEGGRVGDMHIEQKTAADELEREWAKKISGLSTMSQADPIYAMAADSNIVKHRHNEMSKERFISDINVIIEGLIDDDETLEGVFEELLDELEEIQDQATEVSQEDVYYLPLTDRVFKMTQQYKSQGLVSPDYTKIETFHVRLIKAISELIEVPSERTVLPYHWRKEDFASASYGSAKTDKQIEEEKKTSNLLEAAVQGKTGQLRDLGDFIDEVLMLVELAEQYYADPVNDNMLIFKDLPMFLGKRSLSAITTHGKNEMSKLLQSIYIEYYTAFISRAELEDINDYREMLVDVPSDVNITNAISKVEKVINILDDIFPNSTEKNMKYFANRLNNMARKNSNIDLSRYKLNGRIVSELTTEEDVKGTYISLIGLIYSTASEMKKDANKKEEIERFMRLHSSFEDKIKLSATQEKLLVAYDGIRKMMNRPIYYGVCDLGSFNNISDTIDMVKSEYKLDITANDITKIVEEVDSLDSLAKKHGTNEDVIYHIKALYR